MTTRKLIVIVAIAFGVALTGCATTLDGIAVVPPTVSVRQLPTTTPTTPKPTPPTVRPTIPTPSPSPSSTVAPPASPGTSLPFKQTTISPTGGTVHSTGLVTVWWAEWTTTNPADYALDTAPKNGAWLILDVGAECVTGSVTLNPFDWTVKDAVGHSYQVDYMANKEPALHDSGPLAPGEIARGFITFDVPQGPLTIGIGRDIRWVIPAG